MYFFRLSDALYWSKIKPTDITTEKEIKRVHSIICKYKYFFSEFSCAVNFHAPSSLYSII